MAITKKTTRKDIRLQLAKRLEETFSDLQEKLGKSRFKRNIKKASKALAASLKEKPSNTGKKKIKDSKKTLSAEKLSKTAS